MNPNPASLNTLVIHLPNSFSICWKMSGPVPHHLTNAHIFDAYFTHCQPVALGLLWRHCFSFPIFDPGIQVLYWCRVSFLIWCNEYCKLEPLTHYSTGSGACAMCLYGFIQIFPMLIIRACIMLPSVKWSEGIALAVRWLVDNEEWPCVECSESL